MRINSRDVSISHVYFVWWTLGFNDNIVLKHHGHYDGVHLNQLGSSVLYDNLLDVINENL